MIEINDDKHLVKIDSEKINESLEQAEFVQNIFGKFKTVTSTPTLTPSNFIDQIQIYTNGSTFRLYWYDNINQIWHYVTATA